MANIGQTIIVRTDLFNLPEDIGLLSAQVAHIHFELIRKILLENLVDHDWIDIKASENGNIGTDLTEWLTEPYTFIKKVPNVEGLLYFERLAKESSIPVTEWRDTVYVRLSSTMKQAFPNTLVGISLGPSDADKIRTVVGDLPLL
jgi:peptidyl-tRNA hydrolase